MYYLDWTAVCGFLWSYNRKKKCEGYNQWWKWICVINVPKWLLPPANVNLDADVSKREQERGKTDSETLDPVEVESYHHRVQGVRKIHIRHLLYMDFCSGARQLKG